MGYQSNYGARRFSSGAIALARARQTGPDNIARCAMCSAPLTSGNTAADHIVAYWIKPHSGPHNCQLLCSVPCHAGKTAGQDVPVICHIKRVIRRPKAKHPMPCGRDSRWSRPVGAFRPVPRQSQAERLAATLSRRRFDEVPS
jgi:hypothetical protein